MINKDSPWNKVFWSTAESDFSSEREQLSTDQEELEKERENQPEDAFVDQTSQLLLLKFSLRVTKTLKDLLIPRDQEDSDQRKSVPSERLSSLERRMMYENTLYTDKSKEKVTEKSSIKLQESKD